MKKEKHIPSESRLYDEYMGYSGFSKKIYYLFSVNSNFWIFMAGVISSIPVTLLLNLVGTAMRDYTYSWLYFGVYALTFLLSVWVCAKIFQFTVLQIETTEHCWTKTRKRTGTYEEYYNHLFTAFKREKKEIMRQAAHIVLSGCLTVCCILSLFVLANL